MADSFPVEQPALGLLLGGGDFDEAQNQMGRRFYTCGPANLRPQKAELREAILTRKFNSPKFSVNACASAIDRRVSEEVTCLFWGIVFAGAF